MQIFCINIVISYNIFQIKAKVVFGVITLKSKAFDRILKLLYIREVFYLLNRLSLSYNISLKH